MDEPAAADPVHCAACGSSLREGARFCPRCGHRIGDAPPARAEVVSAWPDVRYTLVVYVVLLGVQALGFALGAMQVGLFTNLLAGDILLAVVALATAPRLGAELLRLYRRPGFGPLGYLGIAAFSYPMAVAVSLVLGSIATHFHLSDAQVEPLAGLGLGWNLIFLCVTPPIFEELVFRGTIFTLLRRHFTLRDALIASAFAFAMMHLSLPTLLTHIPLGLWLGFLRARGDSLWPAMFAHFLHNGWVLLDTRVKVLPY